MSNVFRADGAPVGGATTVSFGERFQSSEHFDHIFKEGMALVERTASYLDGPGRKEAKNLAGGAGVLYATERASRFSPIATLVGFFCGRRSSRSIARSPRLSLVHSKDHERVGRDRMRGSAALGPTCPASPRRACLSQ